MPQTPEYEPLIVNKCSGTILEEYIANDAQRANNKTGTLVYDYVQLSPFYSNSNEETAYINEREAIDLPPPALD